MRANETIVGDEGDLIVLNEIREAMEHRGYVHMANGKDIGLLLDRLAELESAEVGVRCQTCHRIIPRSVSLKPFGDSSA